MTAHQVKEIPGVPVPGSRQAEVRAERQRSGVRRPGGSPVVAGLGRGAVVHRAGQPVAECVYRVVQREVAGRTAESRTVPESGGGEVCGGTVEIGLQSPPAAQLVELDDAGGVRGVVPVGGRWARVCASGLGCASPLGTRPERNGNSHSPWYIKTGGGSLRYRMVVVQHIAIICQSPGRDEQSAMNRSAISHFGS